MANTYTWNIWRLDVAQEEQGQSNVVYQVGWTCEGLSDQKDPTDDLFYTAMQNGFVPVTYVAGEPFTPYDQLTQTQVLGWVTSALGESGVAEVQATIDANIELQIVPIPNPNPPLPWAGA